MYGDGVEENRAAIRKAGLGDDEGDCVLRMGDVTGGTVDAHFSGQAEAHRVVRALNSGGVEDVPRGGGGGRGLGGRHGLLDSTTRSNTQCEETEGEKRALRHDRKRRQARKQGERQESK